MTDASGADDRPDENTNPNRPPAEGFAPPVASTPQAPPPPQGYAAAPGAPSYQVPPPAPGYQQAPPPPVAPSYQAPAAPPQSGQPSDQAPPPPAPSYSAPSAPSYQAPQGAYGQQAPHPGYGQQPGYGQPGPYGTPTQPPGSVAPGSLPPGAVPPAGTVPPGYYAYQTPPPQAQTNVLAIITIIAAFVLSPAGIVTGHIALSQIKRTHEGGQGLAKAGLILSYVFTALWILIIVASFVLPFLILAIVGTASYSTY